MDTVWTALRRARANGGMVIGQIGQSLDGRVATANGSARPVSGAPGLDHLHRLRALCDAVIVGVGTAVADDPQLTVRRVPMAPDARPPARIVIDPNGRVPATARIFAGGDGVRRIAIQAAEHPLPDGVERLVLASDNGWIAPAAIVRALRALGFGNLLIEGGPTTLGRFLEKSMLDRLHVLVAPVLVGSGVSGVALPAIDSMDDALRPTTSCYLLGQGEVLFDLDFQAANR